MTAWRVTHQDALEKMKRRPLEPTDGTQAVDRWRCQPLQSDWRRRQRDARVFRRSGKWKLGAREYPTDTTHARGNGCSCHAMRRSFARSWRPSATASDGQRVRGDLLAEEPGILLSSPRSPSRAIPRPDGKKARVDPARHTSKQNRVPGTVTPQSPAR